MRYGRRVFHIVVKYIRNKNERFSFLTDFQQEKDIFSHKEIFICKTNFVFLEEFRIVNRARKLVVKPSKQGERILFFLNKSVERPRRLFHNSVHDSFQARLGNRSPIFHGGAEKSFVEIWIDVIVRIREADVFSSGKSNSRITRFRRACVHLLNHFDPRIASSVFFKDCERAVGRAVVHANDFDVAKRLVDDGIQASAQIFLHVVDGDNDGNERNIFYSTKNFCPLCYWNSFRTLSMKSF